MQINELLGKLELDSASKHIKSYGVLLKDGSCRFFDNELEADSFVKKHRAQIKRYVSLQTYSYDDYLNSNVEL